MSDAPAVPWTILALLRWTTGFFEEKGVAEPRASAEIILAHTLGLSRLDLYLRHDQPLTPEELARFKALIVRRRQGEPVAYLTGHKEFWSLDFLVNPATLIPRPETEVLVQAVLNVVEGAKGRGPLPHKPLAIDVGVGSGALVVALARELPEFTWVGVDISAAALEVARENARRHEVAARVAFLRGDLLRQFKASPSFALMVANLPYVPRGEWQQLSKEIKDYEPKGALLGGEDGLDLLKQLCQQAHIYLQSGGWLALEVGAGQAGRVIGFLEETGAYDTLKSVDDYQAIPRVVLAKRS
jgi:release factor glutamine methyltransferase